MKDPNCIFCKIAAGQILSARVLDVDGAFAFMDIGPLAEGHVLLIPKEHYETVDQMSPEAAALLLKHLPALTKAVKAATGCAGVNILQNNGRVAHQEVMHAHFHIIPRNEGDAFRFNWPAGKYPPGRAEALAKAIAQSM